MELSNHSPKNLRCLRRPCHPVRWTRLTGNLRIPFFFDSKKGQFIKIYFIFLLTTRLGECIISKYFEYSFPKTASVIDIILQSQGLPRKTICVDFFTLCFSRRKVYFLILHTNLEKEAK